MPSFLPFLPLSFPSSLLSPLPPFPPPSFPPSTLSSCTLYLPICIPFPYVGGGSPCVAWPPLRCRPGVPSICTVVNTFPRAKFGAFFYANKRQTKVKNWYTQGKYNAGPGWSKEHTCCLEGARYWGVLRQSQRIRERLVCQNSALDGGSTLFDRIIVQIFLYYRTPGQCGILRCYLFISV